MGAMSYLIKWASVGDGLHFMIVIVIEIFTNGAHTYTCEMNIEYFVRRFIVIDSSGRPVIRTIIIMFTGTPVSRAAHLRA